MNKTLFLFLVFYLTILVETYAQFQIHPDSSFYTFLDSFYHYNQDDSAEGGLFNQVRRDNITWGTRLGPSGNMSQATKARNQYAQTYAPNQTYSRNTPNIPIPIYPNAPSWTELGPIAPVQGANIGKGMGQIHRLAFHPNFGNGNQILYAGSHYGGLYRTDDGGNDWYNYDTDRGLPITSVGGVVVSLNHVFVCTGNGDHGYANFGTNALYDPLRGNINNYNPIHTHGVYRNTNSNNGWQSINGNTTLLDGTNIGDLRTVFEAGGTMRQIIVHPTNDAILFIATSQGIFKTNNQGVSWEQVLLGKPNGSGGYILDPEWRGLAFHPTNPNIVYASGKDIYQSVDGGNTWLLLADHTNLPAAFPSGLAIERSNVAVTPAADSLLYVYAIGRINNSSTRYGNILIYNQNNSSWNLLESRLGNGLLDDFKPGWAGIAISPSDANLVYHTGTKVWGSTTALSSTNWIKQSPYNSQQFHADVHDIKFPPNGNGFVYVGTHGGVSKKDTTFNNVDGWTALYNGLGVATIWTFDDWEGNDSIIITANQDVGENLTLNRGDVWLSNSINKGDGYGARIEDQSGKAYLTYSVGYAGVNDISTGTPIGNNFIPSINYFTLPYDIPGQTARAQVPVTFPLVNHPKTDIPYLGFSELYSNITCGLDLVRTQIGTSYDTTAISLYSYSGDTIRIWGTLVDTLGNQRIRPAKEYISGISFPNSIPLKNHCNSIGMVIDTIIEVLPNRPLFDYRVDTVCVVDTIYDVSTIATPIYDIPYDQVLDSIWSVQSNLKTYFSSRSNRRILEIAFSEDQNTNYTYLATLGDNINGNRRSDFYFQDADNAACDTCFLRLTDSLPITANATFGDPNPITGIAVDPRDGNRVWVSFSGFDSNIKVYYSADAGQTWTNYDDIDSSLAKLNMPINNIVYQRGTDDRLYIATDVGIYVREAGGNWLRYGNDFPNVRTTELKINYCLGKLRAATFGRGAWEADLLEPREEIAFRSFRTIGTNQTWNTDKNMTRDLKVMAGATLTLSNMTLNMPKGGLIIVEPGGKLVVDSSTITNLCGQTWVGIQIWGNSALTQTPTQQQGHLVLNNSTVEHAKEAMSPWQVDNYTNGTGGIIEATNCTFQNNWRTSGFVQYNSPDRQREKSRFANCTFTVNDDLRTFNNQPNSFLGHISLWDVAGILIEGCTFRDERTNKVTDPLTGGNYGIYALSATPFVRSLQQGSILAPRKRNTFEGLERAIEIGNPRGSNFVSIIDQSDFVGNEQAITIRGQNSSRVIRNTFEIGGFDNNNGGQPAPGVIEEYGVGLIETQGFTLEQNEFHGSNTDLMVGSWIEGTGSTNNNVQNNDYQDLTAGNLAHGDNRGSGLSDGSQFLCNETTNNLADLGVVDNTTTTGAAAQIAINQGAFNNAAQNTFSVASQYHFYVSSSAPLSQVNYWYDPTVTNQVPDQNKVAGVNLSLGNNTAGLCDDNYTSPNTTSTTNNNGNPMRISRMKNQYYRAANKYTTLEQKYTDLLDKGSTANLIAEVLNTAPANKGDLKDTLLRISPFLSKEVLLTVADCGLFNKRQLKRIIKANPDVILDKEFMHYLKDSCNSPLDSAAMVEIAQSPQTTLVQNRKEFRRTKLLSKIGKQYQRLNFWATEVYHYYATDTTPAPVDTLRQWISNKKGLSAEYELVEHYWSNQKYEDAFIQLDIILQTYPLEDLELQNHEVYIGIKQLEREVIQDERTLAELKREEVIYLQDIANLRTGFASSYAANICAFFYTPSTRYYPLLPNLNGRSNGLEIPSLTTPTTLVTANLLGYPNPANSWMDLIYDLPTGSSTGELTILHSNGQLIQRVNIDSPQGTVNLNTTQWTAGIYFATLWSNGEAVKVYQIIIRR